MRETLSDFEQVLREQAKVGDCQIVGRVTKLWQTKVPILKVVLRVKHLQQGTAAAVHDWLEIPVDIGFGAMNGPRAVPLVHDLVSRAVMQLG
jgi:hypothetical protein